MRTRSTADRDRQRALDAARKLILEMLRDTDARIYLFGSCATATHRKWSDIDIAIDPRKTLPAGLLSDVCEAFEESSIPFEVEVVDLRDADPEFRARVRREGILWRG